MNNTNPTKLSTVPSTQSNLLGKVDLDDEDDLLTKYQSKKAAVESKENEQLGKFTSNVQTMIDSKWNQHKTSFNRDQEDEEEGEEDEEEEDFYPITRHRTSSSNSAVHSKLSVVQPRKV